MALTTAQQELIVKTVVGVFDAAPGATYLNLLSPFASNQAGLVAALVGTDAFKAIYPDFYSNEQFATKFLDALVGSTVDATNKANVATYAAALLNGGASRANVVLALINALDTTTNTDWANAAKAFHNQVTVAKYYTVDQLGSATSISSLQSVIAGVTNTTDVSSNTAIETAIANSGAAAGQTFTLTTATDTVTGTSGNDTINGGALAQDGVTAADTLNALDNINGGAGVDTLVLDTTGNKNSLTGTISNVENLTYIGSGTVNGNAVIDLSSFSGKFTLQQNADTAVSVSNVTGQTLILNKVADTTTLTAALDAAQASLALVNTAAVGAATFSVAGAKLATINVSTDKTAAGKTLTVADTGNTTKTVNVDASAAAAVVVNSTALETVKITGAGAVTLTAGTAPSKALDASGSTGGVTYAVDLVAQQFTGGAGSDTVQFGATTKAQTLGAGNDKATISADLGTGGSIDAGDGTDTLSLTATLADTLDANTNFNAKVSNFEKLQLTTVGIESLDLANLDGLNYVSLAGQAGGAGVTLNNFVSGGTLEITDTAAKATAVVKDAATNLTDVLNVVATAAANKNVGTVVVANVETVNINSDDTAAAPTGAIKHTVVLTADKATKVVVTGDAQLDLTLTGSTKVATIDASANTAGITTSLTVASGITLTGTAKADTITLGDLSVVTGGAGTDAYTVTTPTNGNSYATITDFTVGETIKFTEATPAGTPTPATLGSKVTLAGTAAFADFLAAASAADGSANSAVKWFQYSGDTYVVFDNSASLVSFDNSVDQIVKLTGTLDLSKSTVDAAGLLTFVAA